LEAGHRDFWKGHESVIVLDYERGTKKTLWWPEKNLVAPLTTWLEVELDQSWDSQVEYSLKAWTAARDAPGERVPLLGARQALQARFAWRLCDQEPDEFYQKFSRWLFALEADATGDQAARQAADDSRTVGMEVGLGDGPLEFALTVVAHRGEPPENIPSRTCPL
jgi:hypothetical protein